MEGEKEDSTVQGSKDREIELISRQVSRKGKGIQKKKLSDTQCILILLLKDLSHQKI